MPPSAQPVPRSHQRETLEAFLEAERMLAPWLRRPETQATLDGYDAAEAKAQRRQRRYLTTARRATIFSTLGTAMAAVALLPLKSFVGDDLPPWVGLVQLGFVIVAMVSIWIISWRHLLDRWMRARASAEEQRALMFRDLMHAPLSSPDAGAPAIAAQLKAFETCHLDYQRVYFRKRGGQLAKAASSVTPMKLAGYVIIAFSFGVSLIVAIKLAHTLGVLLPPWLDAVAGLSIPDPARLQLGLGALSSAALSFAASWTLINQDDRNASRYAATLRRLDAAVAAGLADARAAAVGGRVAEVVAFTDRIQVILDAEHAAWVAARPSKNPTAGPGHSLGAVV